MTMECYPLHLILKAAGIEVVHYFSLDVEGVDMEVLEAIHWDKVDIKVIMVEYPYITVTKCKNKLISCT